MKKVTFTKSPTGAPFFLAYNEGDTVTVGNETADKLVEKNLAVIEGDAEEAETDITAENLAAAAEAEKKAAEKEAAAAEKAAKEAKAAADKQAKK